MSGKLERDIWGALGLVGDIIGRDVPAVKQAADHVRSKVGLTSPFEDENDEESAPESDKRKAVSLKYCAKCDVHYFEEHECENGPGEEEQPETDVEYQVFDARGKLVATTRDGHEAMINAVKHKGFVRPVEK